MYLAIDLGGTKTLVATFSPEGEIIEKVRFPTAHDYELYLQDLTAQVATLKTDSVDLCVMAIPGLIEREPGVAISLGNLPWRNKPIRDDVSRALNGLPMVIENDAKLAGLSEGILLKDTYDYVLYLTISTGIGGALVHNGEIVEALQDLEIGKTPLIFEGKLIDWEDFAGGRGVIARFGKRASEITDPKAWETIGNNIAYGLGIACAVLQPDAIVFDGGVGQFADKFKDVAAAYLKQHLHSDVRQPQALLVAKRTNEAVIYGCYELAKRHHGNVTGRA
jgi:predicted NBD/HSP70 family sugar kinase